MICVSLVQIFSNIFRCFFVTRRSSSCVEGVESGSGTVGGRSPGWFFRVLPMRSIQKPDTHRKDIIQQESLGTDVL